MVEGGRVEGRWGGEGQVGLSFTFDLLILFGRGTVLDTPVVSCTVPETGPL